MAPTAAPLPTATPPPTATPLPTATPVPPLPGSGPELAGELVAQANQYDVYLGYDSFDVAAVKALLPQIDAALEEAELALGSRLLERSSMAFYRPGRRPMRGVRAIAYTSERRMELFYGPHEDPQGAVRVAAHELSHQLEYDRYGAKVQQLADTILHEGLATWLAGSSWLAPTGASSWQERGRMLQAEGRLLKITIDPTGARANDAYEGWASFVDYLIATHGWDAFDDLYRSSQGRYPGSARYTEVYGASLAELVERWHAWLQES